METTNEDWELLNKRGTTRILEDEQEEKKKDSLLDLFDSNEKAKLWTCILTSIIQLTKLKEEEKVKYDSDYIKNNLEKLSSKVDSIELKQYLFNKNQSKASLVQVKRKTIIENNADEKKKKRTDFLEKSLKDEQKVNNVTNFKISEYSHELFNNLRSLHKISYQDFYESFDIQKNFELNLSNSKDLKSKSGSVFFFTYDNKFLLKSASNSEIYTFSKCFHSYFDYFFKEYQTSILGRIFGVYTIQVENYKKINLILMENVMRYINNDNFLLHRIYDLKGSTYNRFTTDFNKKYKEQNDYLEKTFGKNLKDFDEKVYKMNNKAFVDGIGLLRGKDCDFVDNKDFFISLKSSDKNFFSKQIIKDTEFLEKCNLMDYSLIFAISLKKNDLNSIKSKENNHEEENYYQRFRFYCENNEKRYFSLSIVDYLQSYDFSKKMETQFKSIVNENKEFSCVEPVFYRKRFIEFVNNAVISEIKSKKNPIKL